MRSWDKDAFAELRAATYRGDGVAVVEVLRGRLTEDVLQVAGDGLLAAVAQATPEATELAAECEAALRERDWTGDEELADQLSAILNDGPTPMLRLLPVELDQLSDLLEGDPAHGGGQIDLETGICWPEFTDFEEVGISEDELEESDRWLYVDCRGSRDGYRDMERFISTLDDVEIANRLSIAIQGKGAFRRFGDVLSRWPAEVTRYVQFSAERKLGRARAWLAAEGYRPVKPAGD